MRIDDLRKLAAPNLGSLDDARLAGARRAAERGDAKETARQFEKLFAVLLVRELRRSMPQGMFGDAPGADVYEGWFDEHLGSALAAHDALGLTGMVQAAIGRAQAARDAAAEVRPADQEQRP